MPEYAFATATVLPFTRTAEPVIAIVDYAKGNLQSVQKGLEAAGARDVRIVTSPVDIALASAVVLPGVGAFADASCSMQETGQMDAVRDHILAGKPFLGICLGIQLLFEEGTEGVEAGKPNARGIGILPGVADRLPSHDAKGNFYKIPHVGWNSIDFAVLPNGEHVDAAASSGAQSASASSGSPTEVGFAPISETISGTSETLADFSTSSISFRSPDTPLLDGIEEGEHFYFTHSFIAPDSPYTQATTTHSTTFPCFIDYQHTCFGVQFHPEKSSDAGLAVLRNFVQLVP